MQGEKKTKPQNKKKLYNNTYVEYICPGGAVVLVPMALYLKLDDRQFDEFVTEECYRKSRTYYEDDDAPSFLDILRG